MFLSTTTLLIYSHWANFSIIIIVIISRMLHTIRTHTQYFDYDHHFFQEKKIFFFHLKHEKNQGTKINLSTCSTSQPKKKKKKKLHKDSFWREKISYLFNLDLIWLFHFVIDLSFCVNFNQYPKKLINWKLILVMKKNLNHFSQGTSNLNSIFKYSIFSLIQ